MLRCDEVTNLANEKIKGVVTCPGCGGSLTIVETEAGDLGCLPFTGPESRLLAGYTKMRSGEVRYIGYNGQAYGRDEAIAKFGQAEVDHQDAKMQEAESTAIKLGGR